MLVRKTRAGLAFALIALLIASCSSAPRAPAPPKEPATSPLRVAVPPDAPPYAFRQGNELVGLEVDFAHELAAALGRPLDVLPVAFADLVPTLLAGRADLAMAGMTITAAREVRIAFSDP